MNAHTAHFLWRYGRSAAGMPKANLKKRCSALDLRFPARPDLENPDLCKMIHMLLQALQLRGTNGMDTTMAQGLRPHSAFLPQAGLHLASCGAAGSLSGALAPLQRRAGNAARGAAPTAVRSRLQTPPRRCWLTPASAAEHAL